MKRWYGLGIALSVLSTGIAALGDGPFLWNDPAFRWGDREFSRQEATRIAALTADAPRNVPEAHAAIRAQIPLLSGIVLCERSGIGLSVEQTLQSLRLELLSMPPAEQSNFQESCRRLQITPEEFLQRQAARIDRQFQVAVRAWYRKNYAGEGEISDEQVRDWYFRNQERFLLWEIDRDRLFVLPDGGVTPEQVAAWLKQGMTAENIRRKIPTELSDESIRQLLRIPGQSGTPEAGYTLHADAGFRLLVRDGAVRKSYRKLTPELAESIRNALYDALAKARLAEQLRHEGGSYSLIFY